MTIEELDAAEAKAQEEYNRRLDKIAADRKKIAETALPKAIEEMDKMWIDIQAKLVSIKKLKGDYNAPWITPLPPVKPAVAKNINEILEFVGDKSKTAKDLIVYLTEKYPAKLVSKQNCGNWLRKLSEDGKLIATKTKPVIYSKPKEVIVPTDAAAPAA